jgi:hypothetical protein
MPEEVRVPITKTLSTGNKVVLGGKIKMREFCAWVAAENSGDLAAAYPYIAKVIMSWDITTEVPVDPEDPAKGVKKVPLDPRDPVSYGELDLSVYGEIGRIVGTWLRGEIEGKN